MKKKLSVGLLIIATGKYDQFVPPLLDSANKYFLTDHNVVPIIFSNKDVSASPYEKSIKSKIKHEPWPLPTLKRFHYFTNISTVLEAFDLLYYIDADMLFVDKVGDEIIGDFAAVCHPGFYFEKRLFFYGRDPATREGLPTLGRDRNYYAGGFNGGRKYLEMAKLLVPKIDHDMLSGEVPEWHDETYMNEYLKINKPDVILSPEYCFPESSLKAHKWRLDKLSPKIMALEKNHEAFRSK